MPQDRKEDSSLTSGFGMAMGLAAELVATTMVGAGLGWLLSLWVGNAAITVTIGTMLGGAAGVNRLYRTWKRNL